MVLISSVLSHCKSTKPKNHTSTLSITYFCKTEYLVRIKINCVCGWLIIFHLLILLFYLLYCNITILTSPEITLVFFYYFLCVKWNFVFTLRNSGLAKTGPVPTPCDICILWKVVIHHHTVMDG